MKKAFLPLLALLCFASTFANPQKKLKAKATTEVAYKVISEDQEGEKAAETKSPIAFKELKHSFGKIKQGVPVTYEFSFKNISKEPVVIENAIAGCGCTTPVFSKAPILGGHSDVIKVTYNALSVGTFEKKVTVTLAKNSTPIELMIVGEVLQPASEAPKN